MSTGFLYVAIIFILKCTGINSVLSVYKPHTCYKGLDIVHVQDISSSFDGYWHSFFDELQLLNDVVLPQIGSTRYSIVSFGDKPVYGYSDDDTTAEYAFGYKEDYCAHVELPLQSPNLQAIQDILTKEIKTFKGGGGDYAEASLEALYRAVSYDKLGWYKPEDISSTEGTRRVVVLVTDSISHFSGDITDVTGKIMPPFTLPSSRDDINAGCSDMDYPTIEQVVSLLNEQKVHLVLLTAPGIKYEDGEWVVTETLASQGEKYQAVDGIFQWYKDLFFQHGFTDLSGAIIEPRKNVYALTLQRLFYEFSAIRCSSDDANPLNDNKGDLGDEPGEYEYPSHTPETFSIDISTISPHPEDKNKCCTSSIKVDVVFEM